MKPLKFSLNFSLIYSTHPFDNLVIIYGNFFLTSFTYVMMNVSINPSFGTILYSKLTRLMLSSRDDGGIRWIT